MGRTQDFLRISVDTRLHTLLDLRFNQPFFQRGDFHQIIFNVQDHLYLTRGLMDRIQRLSIRVCLFFLFIKTLLYRILPYHERGRRLYQWMVPSRTRQKTVA